MTFELDTKVMVKDLEMFDKVCMKFHFESDNCKDRDCLIFCRKDCIFKFNFRTSEVDVIHNIIESLFSQPQFFELNYEQTICVIGSH